MSKKNCFGRHNKSKPQDNKFKGIFIRLLLIIILALIIYSNTFNASWHFDDYPSILENYKIKDFSTCLRNILSNSRGICDLSFTVNYYINGSNVFGFHIINLAIHIVSAFMVYLLISFTLNIIDEKTANKNSLQFNNLPLIGSLIFVAHPIQTQAVTYIVQRYTSLATMFYLMALVLFIKARMNLLQRNVNFFSKYHFPFYLCSFLCAFLAMRTKEIAVTIPLILLLYDFIFVKRTNKSLKSFLLYLFPFLILLLIILILRIFFISPDATGFGDAIYRSLKDPTARITRGEYTLTQINVLLTYLRLLFFPINQNIYYTYPISNSVFSHYTYLSFFGHIAIFILAIVVFKRSKLISFGIFWFYITVSVESGIVLIADVIFEHRVYLPSVGFVLFLIGLITLKVEWKNIFYVFFGIIILTYSIATYNRNIVWKNGYSLWTDTLKKAPYSYLAHNNLGVTYTYQGKIEEAIKQYQIALNINSNNAEVHYNLGNVYYGQRRVKEAMKEYQIALRLAPDYARVHNNLGRIYYDQGQMGKAIKEFQAAIIMDMRLFEAHINLGSAYDRVGRLNEAIKEYKTALEIKPENAVAHNNLGRIYYDQGQIEKAIKEFQTAIIMDMRFFEAHINLGSAYDRVGRLNEAIKEYKTALEIKPENAVAHNNLGNIYHKHGELEEAIKEYHIALSLKPDFNEVYYNLGNTFFSQGQFNEAIKNYKSALNANVNPPKVHFKLGNAYFNEKRVEEAIDEYKAAIRLKPDYAEAHFNLGIVYKNMGLLSKAKEEIKTVLKINPGFAMARQAIESISK